VRRVEYGHVVRGVEGPLDDGLIGKASISCFTVTSAVDARDDRVESLQSEALSSSTCLFFMERYGDGGKRV
jgi:hypothetical protein